MSFVHIPQDAPFFIGLLLFNALVLWGCHVFRGRLTLGPLFASAGAMTLLFWQMRHLGWWLQWGGLVIDTASYAFIPPLLMGLVFCYAFDGTRAARAYWAILIFTSSLSWCFAEFRDALAYFVPIPYVLYLPTQAHAATLCGLFMAAAGGLLSYAALCGTLRVLAFVLAIWVAATAFVVVDALVLYGVTLGITRSMAVLPGFWLCTLAPAILAYGYALYGRWKNWYMPVRSINEILLFWRKTESDPFSPHQDFLETHRVISDLRHLNNTLQETQRIHEYQVLHNPLAVITTDVMGLIKTANPAAITLFAVPEEQLLRSSILPYFGNISLRQLCSDKELSALPVVTPQHEERWYECMATPLYNDYHKTIGYQLIVKDVTEFKRREMKHAIEDKVHNIHRTGKMFSHDFSNLFLGIQGALGQIRALMLGQPNEAVAVACEQIAAALSQGRLMLSQLSSGQALGSPQLSLCALAEVMQEALQITNARAYESQVEVCFSVVHNPRVNIDHTQIFRVLTNLISNAISASLPGNRVLLVLEDAGRGAIIRVIDQGKGMSKEQLAHAFDPGFSTKGAGQGGLGLAISYLIVEAHGGLLRLFANEDRGITAEIWLPSAKVTAADAWRHQQVLLALPTDSQLADRFANQLDALECEWVESQGDEELRAVIGEPWDVLLIHEYLLPGCAIEELSIGMIAVIHADLSVECLKGDLEWHWNNTSC